MTERDRCLEALTYTWVCPQCHTAQPDSARMSSGTCQTCVDHHGWLDRYDRALKMQGRWRDGDGVSVSETAVGETAQHARDLRPVRIAACADHAAAERAPVSGRDKSYATQLWETVWVSLAFVGLGLIGLWIRAWGVFE